MPREGHDISDNISYDDAGKFQSTCPARGTTRAAMRRRGSTAYFNPRAPRGARHGRSALDAVELIFQSTCPARGTTTPRNSKNTRRLYFNPRAPRGARRRRARRVRHRRRISIHVPREGHDLADKLDQPNQHEFQSTCPARGTTRCRASILTRWIRFQSTCPARGTTANMHNFFVQICARVTNIPLKGMPYLQKTYVSI